MASFHKQINFISLTIILTTGMTLIACTEKGETGNQLATVTDSKEGAEKTSPTVTFDMSDPMQREAAEGDTDALYDLAYRYQDGKGVPKDEAKALELFRRAAQDGRKH